MRNLNLSRLARASEGAYFKDAQSVQANQLRKKLTKSELSSLQQIDKQNKSLNQPTTVDVLPEISAHRAYTPHSSRVISQSSTTTTAPTIGILSRIRNTSSISTPSKSSTSDPSVLRALGSGRLQLYASLQEQTPKNIRPLPGATRYADGAVLGLTSFSVASAIVASVGLAGVMLVYFKPDVITDLKLRTQRFRDRIDRTIGVRLRDRIQRIQEKGPWLADAQKEKATAFAHGAVGIKTVDNNDETVPNDENQS